MMEWVGGTPVGLWLILGIILLPVYGMLLAWFLGKPRNFRLALRGFIYLSAMVVVLWGGLFAFTMLLRFVFFNS